MNRVSIRGQSMETRLINGDAMNRVSTNLQRLLGFLFCRYLVLESAG